MMTINQRRFEILRKVETGELTIEEGSRLLAALESGNDIYESVEALPPIDSTPPAAPSNASQAEIPYSTPEVVPGDMDEDAERRMKRWQRWWILLFGVGVFITILGAYWMFQGYTATGLGWRFWLSWFPFGFGLLLMVVSWYSQTLPWVHIRVREGKHNRTNISLSVPIPIGLASWGLRRYRSFAPEQYEKVHLDEVMTVMNETLTQDAPMHIVVDDEDGGHVEIFITGGRTP
jgi:hypothetical protein